MVFKIIGFRLKKILKSINFKPKIKIIFTTFQYKIVIVFRQKSIKNVNKKSGSKLMKQKMLKFWLKNEVDKNVKNDK